MNTTRQFMARDAQAIALDAFAQAYAPLPKFPALPPAAAPLALPSTTPAPVLPSPVVQWGSVAEVLEDTAPVLALYPAGVPLPLSHFLNPNDSIQQWLTSALPLVLAPDETPVVQPAPVAPMMTAAQSRKPKTTGRKTKAGTRTMAKRGDHKQKTKKAIL